MNDMSVMDGQATRDLEEASCVQGATTTRLLTEDKVRAAVASSGCCLPGVIDTQPVQSDPAAKVNGRAVFAIDVRVPGMKYAAIKHAPVLGTKVVAVKHVPDGIVAVNLETAVAAVAADSWAARKALNSLTVTWTSLNHSDQALVDTAKQGSSLTSLFSSGLNSVAEAVPSSETAPSVCRVIASQPHKLSLTYSIAMTHRSCLEVLTCTVQPIYGANGEILRGLKVWCAASKPQEVARALLAHLPELGRSDIKIATMPRGGGDGQGCKSDFVVQAMRVALAAKSPVKLMWWREEDLVRDHFRPAAAAKIQIGLDTDGSIVAWYNRVVAPSVTRANGQVRREVAYSSFVDEPAVRGATGAGPYQTPYTGAMPRRVVDYVEQKTGFNLAADLAVGSEINCFAIESAIDECARLLCRDPLEYRLSLLRKNARFQVLLEDVAWRCGWGTTLRPGTARGIALGWHSSSPSAVVVEVIQVRRGTITGHRVRRIFCSMDSAIVVSSDHLKARMECEIIRAMNTARWGRMQFNLGMAQVRNFDGQKLALMADVPQIDIHTVENGISPDDLDKVAFPSVAPAIANAFAALTGIRKRNLPLGF